MRDEAERERVDAADAGFDVGDVRAARRRIADLVAPSPLIRSAPLSERLGAQVWLKLETLQPPGSFKVRGAANKLLSLTQAERDAGVIASSAGNHGAAVAYIAGLLGIRATICVPAAVDPVKLAAIRGYGAEAVAEGRTFDEAVLVSLRLQAERGLTYVHPFDDPVVMAGQGTIALEILDDLPQADAIVTAVSGGGLAGGVALAAKAVKPGLRTIGVSAERAAAMDASVRAGRLVDVPDLDTLASVLAGGLGDENRYSFPACRRFIDEWVQVTEPEIAAAMVFALRYQHVLAEGGGAVGVAAALAGRLDGAGSTIAIVVSGGNVDPKLVLSLVESTAG
ncbi:MAG TPA: threonine/serine dehydratase [Actinomycetota bacterium]|jgi:threonine dehydratase